MNRRYLLATLVAGALFIGPGLYAQTMQTLLTNGPTDRRINIVFLSEGYTAAQLGQFTNNSRTVLNNFLTTPPLREYSNYFNAYAICVASNESGSDHPSSGIYRDTWFNSTYDSYGITRLITIDYVGQSRVNSLLATFMPQYDIVALIVNDTAYGGSGGFPLIASINSSSAEIAIHELGHSFCGLGDEYSDPYPGYPDFEEPNTTTETNRALIKWTDWILPQTLIPTPAVSSNSAVVGLFEGAHYHATGWYRPKLNCKMRSLGVPFCEVCSEAFVLTVYWTVRPVDLLAPATNCVPALTNADLCEFSVTPLVPSTHALDFHWFTNDAPVPGATSSVFAVSGFALPAGTNHVRVDVADNTPLVRTDPDLLLVDTRTWQVQTLVVSPVLSAAPSGSQVALAWTPNAVGFALESRPNLASGPGWTPLLTISNQPGALVNATGVATFFRLRRP